MSKLTSRKYIAFACLSIIAVVVTATASAGRLGFAKSHSSNSWAHLKSPGGAKVPAWAHRKRAAVRVRAGSLSLPNVSADRLAATGVVLTPTTAQSPITADAAQAAAAKEPGGAVLATVWAQCHVDGVNPTYDRPCWVVDKEPGFITSSGPIGTTHMAAKFAVTIVDAATSQSLWTFAGG
jgi:hypothetical protein